MNNTVYVAYACHIDNHVTIIGVYYNADDAKRDCDEWEKEHVFCRWATYEPFEIR